MSQQDKALKYNALKEAGIELTKPYRNYTEAELTPAYDRLMEIQAERAAQAAPPPPDLNEEIDPEAAAFFGYASPEPVPHDTPDAPVAGVEEPTFTPAPELPEVRERDPEEFAGQRLNSKAEDEPIRTDEQGRVWYQEEVLKPAYAKPRGRRVLQYEDPGVQTKQAKTGDFIETFEVAGTQRRISEVKITLPSYQVGIYAGNNGFDLFEVQDFYGGAELVPVEIKRIYVENVLCYDVRTTVRAIETEARQLQLQGRI
jgi:hypothetical protein